MTDSYLEVARRVIREVKLPLRARTILQEARLRGLLPCHVWGKTQHKTMGARLSEEILKYGDKSDFCRTGPGTFFLRELFLDPSVPKKYKKATSTRRRAKELQRETVLTIPRSVLERECIFGFVDNVTRVLDLMHRGEFAYIERKKAERDYSIKQLVTYIVVIRGTSVLSYRRGRYSAAADEMKGFRSIGFGGHVADTDVDLWTSKLFGIQNNAIRELAEELDLAKDFLARNGGSFSLCSFLNVDDTDEARKHVAAIVLYRCPKHFEPKKGELSINDLQWLSIESRPNHMETFELWSQLLLERFFNPNDLLAPGRGEKQSTWAAQI